MFIVINNYGAATAGFGNSNSTPNGAANGHRSHFAAPNSPGPTIELYNSSQDSVPSYVQATSPQPASAFPPIAVSRVSLKQMPVLDQSPPGRTSVCWRRSSKLDHTYSLRTHLCLLFSTDISYYDRSSQRLTQCCLVFQGPLIAAAFTNGYHWETYR